MRLHATILAIATLALTPIFVAAADGGAPKSKITADAVQIPVDVSEMPSDLDFLFNLDPKERVLIRERQLIDQNATFQPLRDVEPLRSLVSISGSADSIPEVFVTPDYPSAVVFTDITGKPWPIQYIGQTGSLADVIQTEGSDNSLVLLANNGAGRKSISVFLKGLSLPITITVTGKNNEYHALKHIRITERGPNSVVEHSLSARSGMTAVDLDPLDGSETVGTSLDNTLNQIAYNVTPEGYKKLKSSDRRVSAWIDKGNPKYMYLRTDYSVTAPAPVAGVRGVTPIQDNLRIYVLPRINPIMVLDEAGQRIYLSFKE
ncbi:DotH/IcmK family type IV secretion protein [Marinobacter sp. ELB17]|uniref:DotH/IcmK family type IV secretion protein n=1 Tax=Marinobacter sp. ELB17 TaxID=270374 RepID=UPI0000F381DE|nr:DotH/IcmK family type IV secretion protein [Marinobacter sp. ELB17]EAZ98168.1 DotH [Marinobacter sp. ELB17]